MPDLYWSVLDATRNVLLALPEVVAASVVAAVRKRPFFSQEHGDTFPFVCLAPSAEEFSELMQTGDGLFIYPVLVAFFQQKGATLENEAQLQLQLGLRDAARRALWKPYALPTLTQQIDCDYDPRPAFDLRGLDELFDVSLQRFSFHLSDARN